MRSQIRTVLRIANRRRSEKNGKKRKKWWLAIPLVLILLAGGALIYAVAGGGGGEITVPDTTERTFEAAKEMLESAGLKVNPEPKQINSDEIAVDRVVKTDPAAATLVKKNKEVTIYLSSGGEKIQIDDVTGLTYDEAKERLVKQGVEEKNISRKEEYDDKVAEGKVVSQDPAAKTEIDVKEQTVTLVISKGVQPVEMSDYVGFTIAEARAELSSLGFTNITEESRYSADVPAGNVMEQTPRKGETAIPGKTAITLVVSKGTDSLVLEGLRNKTETEANNYLTQNGLVNGGTGEEYSESVEKGKVVRTEPEAGTTLKVGDSVKLILSLGKEPTASSEPQTTTFHVMVQTAYKGKDGAEESVILYLTDATKTNEAVDDFKLTPDLTHTSNLTITIEKGKTATISYNRSDGTNGIVQVKEGDTRIVIP